MGATNSTRKLTIDSIALLETLEPNATEATTKASVRARIQAILAKEWPSCRVLPFGSSESGLGFGGSDLDLGMYFDDVDLDYQAHFTATDRLQLLSAACTRLATEFEIHEFVQHARVPVIKLWDPVARVACDLCIGSVHVLLNTALLKHFARADPRVRPLAFAIKHWAKQRGINDSVNGTLSSYGFMLLLIFFLQSSRAQSLLPPVEAVFKSIETERSLPGLVCCLEALTVAAKDSTFGSSESDSVGALLIGFFRFYAAEFNYEHDVVSVRGGYALTKAAKWNRPTMWRLSIEDPFELTHDVARVVFSQRGQELIRTEFTRAYEMAIKGHRLEEICGWDETSWNWLGVTCYICAADSHTARECKATASVIGSASSSPRRSIGSPGTTGMDCWYCGESGHVKATCPLYAYVAPIPTQAIAPMTTHDISMSSPIPIHSKMFVGESRWPSDTPSHSPVRCGKRKKRQRRNSVSSMASSPEQERTRKYIVAAGQLVSAPRKCTTL